MSELSAKIATIRGKKSIKELLLETKVSRETWRKIERGTSVKLSTLKQISDNLKLPRSQWLDLVTAWVKTEIGPEASQHLWIEPKNGGSKLHEGEQSQTAKMMMLFTGLPASERLEILKAMERKEVRNCIPAINRGWEKLTNR